jgi:hypothetical protein
MKKDELLKDKDKNFKDPTELKIRRYNVVSLVDRIWGLFDKSDDKVTKDVRPMSKEIYETT